MALCNNPINNKDNTNSINEKEIRRAKTKRVTYLAFYINVFIVFGLYAYKKFRMWRLVQNSCEWMKFPQQSHSLIKSKVCSWKT